MFISKELLSFPKVMNPFRSFRLLDFSSARSLATRASQLNCKSTSRKTKSSTATGGAHPARSLDGVAKGVEHLLCKSSAEGGFCHVYLVGTRHMSQESCKKVKAIMKFIKPQALFLELCESMAGEEMFPPKAEISTMNQIVDMWKKHNIHPAGICSIWSLEKEGVAPKSEFRVAYEEALSSGAKVYLGDRPIHITNSRVKAVQSRIVIWPYVKFWYYISFLGMEDITKPKNFMKYVKRLLTWSISAELKDSPDMSAAALEEHKKAFPSIWETILTERDMYMSRKLWDAAREHSSVVAVVGQAHLPGIKRYWAQPIEVENLLKIPMTREGRSNAKVWVAVGALIGTLIWARN